MIPMNRTAKDSTEESKTKDQDIKDSLKDFDIDADKLDLAKEFDYVVKIPKDSKDKMLGISRTIKVSVLTISGYEEVPTQNKDESVFRLQKHPLASSEVIKHFESILKTYADESNLIGKQSWDSFKIQAMADWGAFYRFCLREKASPETNERTVYRVFQNCLIKIGEITCDNPTNIKTLFSQLNDDMDKEEGRNMFQ